MIARLYDFDIAVSNGRKMLEKAPEILLNPISMYVADGYSKDYKQPTLKRKEARAWTRKILDAAMKPYEDSVTRAECRYMRRKLYNRVPYEACIMTAPLSRTISGGQYTADDDNNYIVYFIDNIVVNANDGVHLPALVRTLIAVVAHERTHYAYKDSEHKTPNEIAEPRADKVALEFLKKFHDSNIDLDDTAAIEKFIANIEVRAEE